MTAVLPEPVVRTAGSTDPAAPLVVLLHGRGSNERDIIAVAAHLPQGAGYAAVRAPIAEAPGFATTSKPEHQHAPDRSATDRARARIVHAHRAACVRQRVVLTDRTRRDRARSLSRLRAAVVFLAGRRRPSPAALQPPAVLSPGSSAGSAWAG
jgi:hypothetical protein